MDTATSTPNMPKLNGAHIHRTQTTCPRCKSENHRTAGRTWPTLSTVDGDPTPFCHAHGYQNVPTTPAVFVPATQISVGDVVSGDAVVTSVRTRGKSITIEYRNGDATDATHTVRLHSSDRYVMER